MQASINIYVQKYTFYNIKSFNGLYYWIFGRIFFGIKPNIF